MNEYLGSIQSSSVILRRIGIASSAMHSIQRVWRQRILSLSTKLRLYQTWVLPILLYGSEIWTLLAEDSRRLQSFHMSCQRQILGVRWNDDVRNSDVAVQTGLPNITETIIKRHHMLFGHVARLDATTPAHQILKQVITVKSGYQPDALWRRAPGRPRNSWIMQIGNGSPLSIRREWKKPQDHGHHGEPSQRTAAVVASWWWWLALCCEWLTNIYIFYSPHYSGRQNKQTRNTTRLNKRTNNTKVKLNIKLTEHTELRAQFTSTGIDTIRLRRTPSCCERKSLKSRP